MFASATIVRNLIKHRRVLIATTRLELQKKYAGSMLGYAWIGLHPLLFLCAYIVVFLAIFQVKLPGLTDFGYVVFVFSGLIPFLTMMDATTSAAVAIRQNIHLLKNVIVPVELIPIRVIAGAMVVQCVGLALCLALSFAEGTWSFKLLLLPLLLLTAAIFFAGIAMIIAPIGMVVPDLGHGIGLAMHLLMFVSPIAFRRDLVPAFVTFLVDWNPVTYVIEAYRSVLMAGHAPELWRIAIFVAMAMLLFEIGARILMRFKATIVDYE